MTWELFISPEHLIKLGISIGILLVFLFFRKIFAKYIFSILLKVSKKSKGNLFSTIYHAFNKPIQWIVVIIGLYVAVYYYPYLKHESIMFIRFIRIAIILCITWGLLNMAATTSTLFNKINEKTNFKIDEILIPFLSRALQIVIIAIGLTIILKELDYPIDGLIAGLGLGGLAFSLAAKDALANLFGGVIIITERPFTIGDWILTPSVEGTVEDITFRSTKIRTFAQALVTVPNATLANESITNWSKMGKRRITFTITIAYDTPSQKIKKVVNEIDQLLKNHPEVHPETIFVTCDDFSANGLDLYLYFFTNTTDWGAYLKVKEEINLKILDILDAENVVIALPSRKLYVESEQESQSPINETKQRAQDS